MNEVKQAAQELGLFCATYSPGDGYTRYRFFRREGLDKGQSYFGPASGIYTALGRGEAMTWLAGYGAALGMVKA